MKKHILPILILILWLPVLALLDREGQVRDILMKEYGIDGKRIQAQGIGANAQPYKRGDWNRVVVVSVIEE